MTFSSFFGSGATTAIADLAIRHILPENAYIPALTSVIAMNAFTKGTN